MSDIFSRHNFPGPDFREAVHTLNRRYQEAWDRAERLQDELDHIKKSRAYRLLSWWRRVARSWLGFPGFRRETLPPPAFPTENLEVTQVPAKCTVSILIPFKDHRDLLGNCLRSLRRGSYQPKEIILLDNGSTCPRMLEYLERVRGLAGYKVIQSPGPFNFSRICNLGARHAGADFLLFLNNDMEILAADWLEQLLRLGCRADVGIVGATLLYPDRTLQHVGIFPQDGGRWSHAYRGLPHDHPGEHGELRHARTVPAVTGACLLIGRALFSDLGGFDEKYGLTFNDVDLCCRVRERDLKVAISPRARLWHFESMSRGFSRDKAIFSGP